jgi:L-iditol 2-dehydrogenase
MAWPEHCLFPLPDEFTAVDGAMLEPLGVAIHTVDLAHVRPGSSVGVFGSGPIGLFCLQVARAAGAARLVATDLATRPHRLDAARALGAEAFAAEDGREAKAILKAASGRGLDVAIETAGVQAAVDAAAEAVRPGGRLVLAGIPAEERTSFKASTARRKGLTIVMVRRMKHTYPRAIALVVARRVDLRSVVTHRFPLAEAAKAFEIAARREGLKVVVEPLPLSAPRSRGRARALLSGFHGLVPSGHERLEARAQARLLGGAVGPGGEVFALAGLRPEVVELLAAVRPQRVARRLGPQ